MISSSGISESSASQIQTSHQVMLKVGQGLTLQQSPKHPGLVSMFLHGHQDLNLMEGHHLLDPLLSASILEENKVSELIGGWVTWIH
jgi:hypothetical protein